MNLLEVAEVCHRQLFPNPSNMPTIKREEFIATARSEYAYQTLIKYFNDKRDEGYSEVPSILLDEEEFDVVENEIDLSDVRIMRGLPNDRWLQNVGGISCGCTYIKTTINLWQLFCDDDCLSEDQKPFYISGQTIRFPRGAHANTVKVTYAGVGKRVNDRIEIDDFIAGIIRTRLIEIYGGKIGTEDTTNNGSSKE